MNQTLAQPLLDALADHGSATVTELATTLDAHPVTVDRQCYDLQTDGYIQHVGSGRYTLTKHGEQFLMTVVDD